MDLMLVPGQLWLLPETVSNREATILLIKKHERWNRWLVCHTVHLADGRRENGVGWLSEDVFMRDPIDRPTLLSQS